MKKLLFVLLFMAIFGFAIPCSAVITVESCSVPIGSDVYVGDTISCNWNGTPTPVHYEYHYGLPYAQSGSDGGSITSNPAVYTIVRSDYPYLTFAAGYTAENAYWNVQSGTNPLEAAISVSDSTPNVGQEIILADASTGDPTSWIWVDDVEGYLGNTISISRAFSTPGSHTINLTVGKGEDIATASTTITVGDAASPISLIFQAFKNTEPFDRIPGATFYVSDGQSGTGDSVEGKWTASVSPGLKSVYAVKGGYTPSYAISFDPIDLWDNAYVNLFLDAEFSPTPTPTSNGTWTFVPTPTPTSVPTAGPTGNPTPGPTVTPIGGSDYAAVLTLDVRDAQTGYYVPGAAVGIRNMTSGLWQNTTTTTGTETFTTTANGPLLSVGQPVTLAASKTGYTPASLFLHIPDSNYRAYLNLVPLTAPPSPGYYSLQVSVNRDEDGAPINGATVTLDTSPIQTATTNTAGSAFFQNVPAGEWQVTAKGDNYAATTLSISGASGETKSLQFYLFEENIPIDEDAITVNVDVNNAVTGIPIGGATVGIQNTSSGIWRNHTTPYGLTFFQSTGTSHEYPLSVGQTIKLGAFAYGYHPGSVTLTIPYTNYRAYINLVPISITPATGYGTLVVNVIRNKDGLPVSGATISVDDTPIKFASSNSAGTSTFYNVTAGTRTITVSTPYYAYEQATKDATITSGETQFSTVQLVSTGETPVPTFAPPTTAVPTVSPYNGTGGPLNATGSAGLIEMMTMVIQLWPLVLILLFLKFLKSVVE